MPVKKKFKINISFPFITRFTVTCLVFFFSAFVQAQNSVGVNATLVPISDLGDLFKKVLNKKVDTLKTVKSQKAAILPSFGYNPSFGFVIGAKVASIKQFGKNDSTNLSSFGLEAIYTSKGIITGQVRHNIFTEANKWNFQGNWQISKFLITDYNLGTGNKNYLTESDSAFPLKFTFIRLTEKIYRKIAQNLFAGAGISFEIRSNIKDTKRESLSSSPHYRYSLRNGFNPEKYSANGLLLALQYNTQEHPTRSYGGIYADMTIRFNQRWLGSTKDAVQLIYDFRKYISLSKKNPEHVFAIWHSASYKLSGTIPYLELPATGYDTYSRSGRGYTIGRFKGLSFAYFDTEYRFPITRNKLLSGVAFMNFQTASDDLGKKVFQYWERSVGGGLRLLLQKQSRSTLCIDYAVGNYGSRGFFFGLNEAF